jgi:hypothetical protein
MSSRPVLLVTALALVAAATPSTAALRKSPAWLSIESPVSPYDRETRGASFLVHARLVEGAARLGDLSGSAEGLVNGTRRTVPLRFETTANTGTFAVRRQWPAEGVWLVRITLHETTALVSLDAAGNVTSSRVPTQSRGDMPLPRAVPASEIDSILSLAPGAARGKAKDRSP